MLLPEMNQQIDNSLAGADNGARSVYTRPKAGLGELTEHKDLPWSKEDSNQPFYHEHAVLSQAAYDPVKFKSKYQQLGYAIDSELSQPSRTVFYNKSKNKAVIAYLMNSIARTGVICFALTTCSGRQPGTFAPKRDGQNESQVLFSRVYTSNIGGSRSLPRTMGMSRLSRQVLLLVLLVQAPGTGTFVCDSTRCMPGYACYVFGLDEAGS
jgi:hypothetical protein